MNHNQQTCIRPINISSNIFEVNYEDKFVVLDDAKHIIGVDRKDRRSLIIENIQNGKADKFRCTRSGGGYITNLLYDKNTGSLYCGDDNGRLLKYKLNIAIKSFKLVRDFGDLGIGWITSSDRFLNFVFFGGSNREIRVLDLSTGELLPGDLQTSIDWIFSIQVCAKSEKQIYLAVSGSVRNYFDYKIDLFNISNLFLNDSVKHQKYLSENSINHKDTFLPQPSTLESKEKVKKLIQEKDSYKLKFGEIHSKYNDLKEKHDPHHKKKKKELTQANNKQKAYSKTKYQLKFKRTTKTVNNSLIGKRSFDEIDSFMITRNSKEDTQKQEQDEDKADRLKVNLNPAETQKPQIEGIIMQR